MTDENINLYVDTDTIIDVFRGQLGINNSPSDMTDDEIAMLMKEIASYAPDTLWDNDKPVFGKIGIGIMISMSLYEFPEFYDRKGLIPIN